MASTNTDPSIRNRSDSTEESELPEHEHKRPRLSDAKLDQTHVMADLRQEDSTIDPAPSVTMSEDKEEGEPVIGMPPLPPRKAASPTTITSPTSKVTINTRPLSSQSLTQPIPIGEEAGMEDTSLAADSLDAAHSAAPEEQSTANIIPPDQPETISISSSPSLDNSPIIEIAEPEDLDQDPAQTKWTGRILGDGTTTMTPSRTVSYQYVQRTFPYPSEASSCSYQRTLESIAGQFHHGGGQDGPFFHDVKAWMEQFVEACDNFTQDMWQEDKEFWNLFPKLAENLLRRTTVPPTGAQLDDLAAFFVVFARITKLIIDFDAQNLRIALASDRPQNIKSQKLLSQPYLQSLAWILSPGVPFYDHLARFLKLDRALLFTPIIEMLSDPVKVALMPSMLALLTEICPALPARTDLYQQYQSIIHITSSMLAPWTNMHNADLTFNPSDFSHLEHIQSIAAQIFLLADSALLHAVTKQLAWLNLETAKVIEPLNNIVTVIAVEIPQIGQDIISSGGVGFADNDLTDLPTTMPYAWKFKILRKFMTNGRMELRVFGVETMSSDLVFVYKSHINGQNNGADHPLVRFLVKFLRENQVAEYIVGVDSHPQLIQRAHNIVGFLCVSKTYTESDTDNIWKVVVDSQDPRMIHEVLSLLTTCFTVYSVDELYYICGKLFDYPFTRFDPQVLRFITELFNNIRSKTNSHVTYTAAAMEVDPITWRLCIRLLREASTEENASLEQAACIRRDFPHHLSNVLAFGRRDLDESLSASGRWNLVLSEAAMNLKNHSPDATGDVQVISCLLQSIDKSLLAKVSEHFEVITLLASDLAHLRDRYSDLSQYRIDLSTMEAIYDIRSQCLHYLISHVPEIFTSTAVQELWSSLYALPQLPISIREAAWDRLCDVMKNRLIKDNNTVVNAIINDHLPSLQPLIYSQGVLEFIRTSLSYTARANPPRIINIGETVSIPGMERMWKVMLEAPPNTVENEATDFIIRQYLDGTFVARQPMDVLNTTHSALVDRSVKQVMASASKLKSYADGTTSGEDEPMVIIASDSEIRAEELRFDRSMLFLRKFLEGIKSRPRYSPQLNSQAQALPDFPDQKGEPVEISIQVARSKYIVDKVLKVTVGTDNTLDELHKYICDVSGYTQYNVLNRGQKITLEDVTDTIAEARIPEGLMIVSKVINTPDSPPSRSLRATSPLDSTIMHHFDDLYDLLEADERLSREVYSFLDLFSAQTDLLQTVRAKELSPTTLLPPNKPFKLMYCSKALRSCIEVESFSSSPDLSFLVYSVHTIVTIFPELELDPSIGGMQVPIVHGLLEALLLALRAKVDVETARRYIPNHAQFVEQIFRFLQFSYSTSAQEVPAAVMARLVMETLMEACLHDARLWTHIATGSVFQDLLATAFISDSRSELRNSLLVVVVSLSGGVAKQAALKFNNPRAPRSRFAAATIDTCLSHLWEYLVNLWPRACLQPEHCLQLCESMLAIMRRHGKVVQAQSMLQNFRSWSSILLKHNHVEIVGQPLRDHVISSLSRLLLEACTQLKAAGVLPDSLALIDELIDSFLFPPLTDHDEKSRLPVLDSSVRETLYALVLALCQGRDDFAAIVSKFNEDLVPEDYFSPIYANERLSLRTEIGYAGLKNLSNTCYLNSLFSQLFMNVEFREFFLALQGGDRDKQKLVVALAKVFANMQNSYEKAIDPSSAVEAITTYEGETIDVSVQMDVDEFFNLLFDRIEGQISPQLKDTFKTMYGGQLVQQVKSKECDHVSERLEPFSAVQVEIKGKPRLEDSLRAYVEGEVLQGENKYSCTSCGRHVDAVKRACLKDVPDNIIFNLKRFDYDIMTGMRTKVNDEFQFPDMLDMAPYTLARLSEHANSEPDIFQLTGIIVHSGTADSGHYYSFIRQRPTVKSAQDAWVQFNDSDVNGFNPQHMRDQCFGGISESGFYHLPKFYNAYMLFYQREASIRKVEEEYGEHDAINPVRVPLATGIDEAINAENELYLRSFCAQDPVHAAFILHLLETMKQMQDGKCHVDHDRERETLALVLNYVHTVSSRAKELPQVEETIDLVLSCASRCVQCATTVAKWFASSKALENAVTRSPFPSVRKSFSNLLCTVLERLHRLKKDAEIEGEEIDGLDDDYDHSLQACVAQLGRLWESITKAPRGWPEYFTTLTRIQRLGDEETNLVLEAGFLEKCTEIVLLHVNNSSFPPSKRLRTRYSTYLTARDRNRPFNYNALISLLASLLSTVELHPDFDQDRTSRRKFSLSPSELSVLGLDRDPVTYDWLKRLIVGRHNLAAQDEILEMFATERKLSGPLGSMLAEALNDQSVVIASTFLRAVQIFCQHCRSASEVHNLIRVFLSSIDTVGIEYGKEYGEVLEWLMDFENPHIGLDPGYIQDLILQHIQHWAPTLLLAPVEGGYNPRLIATAILEKVLFIPLQASTDDSDNKRHLLKRVQSLTNACAQFIQNTILQGRGRDAVTLQPSQARSMEEVVRHCLQYFETDTAQGETRVNNIDTILRQLQMKADSMIETLSSGDWHENSSELADFSAEDYEDLQSP
jgi:ubiquitin carboxyl-terminal hydrolase 34